MLQFLATMVGVSYETSHCASNGSNDGLEMRYRSEIDNHGAEISPLCHFSAAIPPYRRACPYPCFLVKVVPFDEIFINPSDLKHVVKLLGRRGGLGLVITTRLRHLCVFY